MTLEQQSWAEINQNLSDWWAKRPTPHLDEPRVLRMASIIVAAQDRLNNVPVYLRRLADRLETKEK